MEEKDAEASDQECLGSLQRRLETRKRIRPRGLYAKRYNIDTEQVIYEVSTRPILWDSSQVRNKCPSARATAWEEIYRILFPDYEKWESLKQKQIGKLVQMRWKGARDAYIKSKNMKKTNRGNTKRYIFSEIMTFLDKILSTNTDGVENSPSAEDDFQDVKENMEETGAEGVSDSDQEQSSSLQRRLGPRKRVRWDLHSKRCNIDTEQVIHEVSARPVLWDSSDVLYKNLNARANAWEDIYKTLFPDYENWEYDTQKQFGKLVQMRWKTARDCYVKCKNMQKNCSDNVKTYTFADIMTFLDKIPTTNTAAVEHSPSAGDEFQENMEETGAECVCDSDQEQSSSLRRRLDTRKRVRRWGRYSKRFKIDTEQVIYEVSARPVLWDSSDVLYKNINARTNAWEEIYKILFPDYKNWDHDTQTEMEKSVQMRWKAARDSYIKCKNMQKTSSDNVKTYTFSDIMTFLDKIPTTNTAAVEHSPSAGDVCTQRNTRKRKKIKNIRKIKSDTDDFRDSYKDVFTSVKKNLNMLKNDDIAFFISLLPVTEHFSTSQKLMFRSQVIKKAMDISKGL